MRCADFKLFFCVPVLFLNLFLSIETQAEPWLSNRFAQNCAACHAPGRVNRPAKKRKCSLSCEGCHVNPQGGGLRNFYGKWGQKKWLHSLTWSKWTAGEKNPAKRSEQLYAHRYPENIRPKLSEARVKKLTKLFGDKKVVPHVDHKAGRIDERHFEMARDHGNESDHQAESSESFEKDPGHSFIADDKVFESLIPKDDPYRHTNEGRVEAGVDARYFILQTDFKNSSGSISESGEALMAFDFGISVKPFTHNFSFTFEHRYLNDPYTPEWDAAFAQRGITRSAFVKWNELPYNTYAMAGIFRPMFGGYNPNHISLRETLLFRTIGGSQNAVYEGVSFGGAPNVPFFNVSYLFKGSEGIGDQSTGLVANAGMRAVRNGMSGMFSFWMTEKEEAGNSLDKQMMSASGGINLNNRWIGNGEIVLFEEDTFNGVDVVNNKGYLVDLDLKYRIWRELYPYVKYAISNVTRNLSEGSTTESSFGLKFFAYAGLELELLYTIGIENVDSINEKNEYNYMTLQTHAFW